MISSLPNKIVVFKNEDKTFHEKPSDDIACTTYPSREIFIAKPNSGKTLCILNMILHDDFKNIIIVHNAITTNEYNLVDATIVDEIPDIYDEEYFDKIIKTLLIIEDLNYKNMSKEQKHRWNRMYGTWSTHNNISVWNTFQTPFSSPPEIRQMCSFNVLWGIPDYNCMTI